MLTLLADLAPELLGPVGPWVQLGAVGILAFIAIWAVKWAVPKALEMHKEALVQLGKDHKDAAQATAQANQSVCAQMLLTFKEESKECREERRENAVDRAAEREADRKARHDDFFFID